MQSIGLKQMPADDPPIAEGARTGNRLAGQGLVIPRLV
jgi:hypothetical protein